jgi:uncharacterized protein YfaS (alpha-2-macroglobulin family)
MSYIQGTVVKLLADFLDNETKQPIDPIEVILTIKNPVGAVTEHRLSTLEVVNDVAAVGRFFFYLDTSPMVGTWQYQFASTGNEATVGRKEITVHQKLG